ncbi:hypothetical protein LCGC14_1841490 [marine sediment metagenome]|uniref:Uncharacterized protein n=1 Tax=marine sediment metagenome TaxID=412755 RepID=A0A0F9H195_9ZZZZ
MAYIRKCDVCGKEFDEDEMLHTIRSGVEIGQGYTLTIDFCNDCAATLPKPFQRALVDMEAILGAKARQWAAEHGDVDD